MSSTPGTAVTPPGLQLPGSSFFFPLFSDSATPSGRHDSSLSGLAPAPPAPPGFHPRPHCGPMRGAWGGGRVGSEPFADLSHSEVPPFAPRRIAGPTLPTSILGAPRVPSDATPWAPRGAAALRGRSGAGRAADPPPPYRRPHDRAGAGPGRALTAYKCGDPGAGPPPPACPCPRVSVSPRRAEHGGAPLAAGAAAALLPRAERRVRG